MSDLQARREARRRKILENAENRLKKITNKDDNLEDGHSISSRSTISSELSGNSERNFSQFTRNTGKTQPDPRKDSQKRVSFGGGSELRTIYQNPIQEETDSVSEYGFMSFDDKKSSLRYWIIILLALIVRYVFLLSEQYPQLINTAMLYNYHVNKVFVVFFLYQIAEYAFYKPFIPQSGLLNMLFMLNLGIRAENVHTIVIITRVMIRIMQDMMIYFFAFVCSDQLIVFVTQDSD